MDGEIETMRKKELKLVVTFHTTAGMIKGMGTLMRISCLLPDRSGRMDDGGISKKASTS